MLINRGSYLGERNYFDLCIVMIGVILIGGIYYDSERFGGTFV